jgi:hypothetical protein
MEEKKPKDSPQLYDIDVTHTGVEKLSISFQPEIGKVSWKPYRTG